MQFENVTALAKGNVYFDGKVFSHVIFMANGDRKSMGVILPGTYHFGTEAAEIMEMVDGGCSYVLDSEKDSAPKDVPAGSSFSIGANAGFTITVKDAPCHYVCSYITE